MSNNAIKTAAAAVAGATLALTAGLVSAQTTSLRIHTHFQPNNVSGEMAGVFKRDVEAMSGGDIAIELFYGDAIVKSAEIFDAAVTGIIDCDMSGGAYQTGKNPAFQFTGDLAGGYTRPYEQMAWLLHNNGYDALNELYHTYDMEFVGWWIPGPESLSSTRPIRNAEDFKNWKFRSPPGMITGVFKALGASPIVLDFNEVFTSLETGIIEGADAASLAVNRGMGIYDIAKHTNYPGFHSMPADHLVCRKDVWDAMPKPHQAILKVAMQALALKTATAVEIANARAAKELRAQGVNLYAWSDEELAKYRAGVKKSWTDFATTPEAKKLLKNHIDFLTDLGLMQ